MPKAPRLGHSCISRPFVESKGQLATTTLQLMSSGTTSRIEIATRHTHTHALGPEEHPSLLELLKEATTVTRVLHDSQSSRSAGLVLLQIFILIGVARLAKKRPDQMCICTQARRSGTLNQHSSCEKAKGAGCNGEVRLSDEGPQTQHPLSILSALSRKEPNIPSPKAFQGFPSLQEPCSVAPATKSIICRSSVTARSHCAAFFATILLCALKLQADLVQTRANSFLQR